MDFKKYFEEDYEFLDLANKDGVIEEFLEGYKDGEKFEYSDTLKVIYLHKTKREMFLILDCLELMTDKIREVCDEWENKILNFVNFGKTLREEIGYLKYNISLILLCKDEQNQTIDDDFRYETEKSLKICRKIFLLCNDNGELVDDDIIIPFYFDPVEKISSNTTQTEKDRPENRNGIIKNNDSRDNEFVRVMLTLKIDNMEVNIYREQKEDSLYIESTLIFVGDIPPQIKEKILQFAANEKFYNYHVCDMYKSFNFLNSDRKEIKKQFDDFTKPHVIANSLSQKLLVFQNEKEDKIKALELTKIPLEKIKVEENEMELLKIDNKIIDYPQIKLYEEESISVENEKVENAREQMALIKECGYNIVDLKINEVIKFYEAKEKGKIIDELIELHEKNEDYINISIKNSYYSIEKLEEIKSNIQVYSNERMIIESVKKLSDIDTSSKPEIYSVMADNIKMYKDDITEVEINLKKKQNEISDKEKGNEIITALSNLLVSRDGLFKYKNEGNERCPLCGSSEKFNNILKVEELAIDAEDYLKKSNSNLAILKKSKQELDDNLNAKIGQFKLYIIKQLDEKLTELKTQKENFNNYFEKTKHFFSKLREQNISIDEEYLKNISKSKNEIAEILLLEKIINGYISTIDNLLTTLNYNHNFDNITLDLLKKIQIDVKQLINEKMLVSNFTFEIFNKKLLFINNILNNNRIHEKELQIKKYNESNLKIDKEISVLKDAKEKARKRQTDIEKKKAEIEKLELEAVGPYLYKIYSKVIKHTKIKEFRFKRDSSRTEGGATFSDQNNNNILNIFSQGQLGIFMLAYFLANMFKRNDETEFKTYFVDDITSCMDDMNVLSFVDIIKYQLYSKDGVMNQFFFSTCDSNLEKLFVHKMKSFDIDWINFKFNSYAKGVINSGMNENEYFG